MAWRICHFDHKQPCINPNTPINCLQLQVHSLFLLLIILIIRPIICKKTARHISLNHKSSAVETKSNYKTKLKLRKLSITNVRNDTNVYQSKQ